MRRMIIDIRRLNYYFKIFDTWFSVIEEDNTFRNMEIYPYLTENLYKLRKVLVERNLRNET